MRFRAMGTDVLVLAVGGPSSLPRYARSRRGDTADVVTDELCAMGARGALVSVGGDLRARGEAEGGHGWVIAIEDRSAPAASWRASPSPTARWPPARACAARGVATGARSTT